MIDKDRYRATILNGDCPFCGRKNFKVVALHVVQKHGLTRRDLSDLLDFNYTETICSQETSEKYREKAAGRNPQAKKKPHSIGPQSKAGRVASYANLRPASETMSKEKLQAIGRRLGYKNKGRAPWNKTYGHGSRSSYRQGCRCQVCVEAYREYWRGYRAKKRNQTL